MINVDEFYMNEALKQARRALKEDEVPVGCVIVTQKVIIAKAYNRCEGLCDPTAHAEMQAITSACNSLKSKYLNDCTIYTTLEPCTMCAGALFWSKIKSLVYGAADPKRPFSLLETKTLHPKTKIKNGVLAHECGSLLTSFFKKKRKLEQKF